MKIYTIEKDIPIFYLNVPDFPQGIEEKFTELMQMLPDMKGRTFYGISWMNDQGAVVFNSGVNQLKDGEAAEYGGTPFLLPAGEYLSVQINEWMNKTDTIGPTLMELIKNPDADKGFPCVEVYETDKQMTCLVRKVKP